MCVCVLNHCSHLNNWFNCGFETPANLTLIGTLYIYSYTSCTSNIYIYIYVYIYIYIEISCRLALGEGWHSALFAIARILTIFQISKTRFRKMKKCLKKIFVKKQELAR